ncbi:FAD-dependent oxidoreductase [Streptomyces sp. B6B3]|uniref:FAD-dependent oxidoreductase n=1 Tax=Streptomyces sp. B6B3 TaxID=3153570 RepID=UPI00325D6C15
MGDPGGRGGVSEDVLVVGGGVLGLTTAVVLAEAGRRVRVVTREPAARTTSAAAGALWEPYRAHPADRVAGWARRTLDTLTALAATPDETGVRMVAGLKAARSASFRLPSWVAGLPAELRPSLISEGLPAGYRAGYRARLPLLDMPAYLGHLERRLAAAGGVLERRALASLAEAAREAPAIVNCAGLGARELVPDPLLRPVRGQLVVVAQPTPRVDEWFAESPDEAVRDPAGGTELLYVLPQPEIVVLGGTAHEDRGDTDPDPELAARIVERAAAFDPRLGAARVLDHRVGLRPYRPAIRLEREALPGGAVCVHNYGHGGAGVTLSWACASDAAALLTG